MTPERFKHYITGIEKIDKEHWRVFELFASIGQSSIDSSELLALMKAHHTDEEQFMRDINYPYYESHIKAHEDLHTAVVNLCTKSTPSKSYAAGMVMEAYKHHIDWSDMQLSQFVQNSRL
jgi:hemerythrin-like metal-binding protein